MKILTTHGSANTYSAMTKVFAIWLTSCQNFDVMRIFKWLVCGCFLNAEADADPHADFSPKCGGGCGYPHPRLDSRFKKFSRLSQMSR